MNGQSKNWLAAAVALFALSGVARADAAQTFPVALPADDTAQLTHDEAAQALSRGQLSEALRGFNKVLILQPFNALAYYNRGNVRYFRREFELALQDYTAALKYRPGFSAAVMNRGIVYSNLNRFDEAIIDLDNAAEFDPSNPDVFFNRAVVHVKRGAMDRALADYDKILQLEGLNPDLQGTQKRLRSLLSRVEEAGADKRERKKRIIDEINHARTIEQLLEFADRTCIRLGHDTSSLPAHALAQGWRSIPSHELAEVSTPTTRLTAGWTLEKRIGSVTVVQSEALRNPEIKSCWITAKLGHGHWFEDLAALLPSRFQSADLVVQEREGRRLGRQSVIGPDQRPVEVFLSQMANTKVVTLRAVHGNQPGGNRAVSP